MRIWLGEAGISAIVSQSKEALASPKNSAIRGWFLYDEPDNAQPKAGGGYGDCILPSIMFKRSRTGESRRCDPAGVFERRADVLAL